MLNPCLPPPPGSSRIGVGSLPPPVITGWSARPSQSRATSGGTLCTAARWSSAHELMLRALMSARRGAGELPLSGLPARSATLTVTATHPPLVGATTPPALRPERATPP